MHGPRTIHARSTHGTRGGGAARGNPGLWILRGCPGKPAGKPSRGQRTLLTGIAASCARPLARGGSPARPGRAGGNGREERGKEPRSSSPGAAAHGAPRTRGAGPSLTGGAGVRGQQPPPGSGPSRPTAGSSCPGAPSLTGPSREGRGGSCPLHRPRPRPQGYPETEVIFGVTAARAVRTHGREHNGDQQRFGEHYSSGSLLWERCC